MNHPLVITDLPLLQAYLGYASDLDIFVQSVAISASHVLFIRGPKKEKTIISDEDMVALFKALPDSKIGTRDRTILFY